VAHCGYNGCTTSNQKIIDPNDMNMINLDDAFMDLKKKYSKN